ncbi:hypothetical protein Zmor_002438 [Zophobas morio]|uniref:Uncharacterized protein n=1 Tax=Zophobas morio TaxID=2755281 RepID=A0AA38MU55_9CUCU|nr:hypothetical protein Zmor_002438 [Zophobas morio]
MQNVESQLSDVFAFIIRHALFSDTVNVGVSVLLLSLASPDESSLVRRNGPRFYQWLLIRLYVVWSVMLQRLPAVLSRIGIILASPLETAEQEYYSTFCESPQHRGDKKRDSTGVANEIVSCTNCGPNPCTHTANNGCAAEVKFTQSSRFVSLQLGSLLQLQCFSGFFY